MNLEQQRAHYKAVRARLAGEPPPAPPQPPAPSEPLTDLAALPVSPRTRQGLRHVIAAHGAIWRDVVSPARDARLINVRRAVYWLLHCNGFTLTHIGALTNRDPTSVKHGLKKVNSWTRKQF